MPLIVDGDQCLSAPQRDVLAPGMAGSSLPCCLWVFERHDGGFELTHLLQLPCLPSPSLSPCTAALSNEAGSVRKSLEVTQLPPLVH